jgi:tRNA threonylcarbamoyladenosine biosynthesis protein TsaE
MSIAKTCQISSTDSDATEAFAERLGQNCKGGEVIELISDLGGGKTTLVRGLARGLGSVDRVASPTFTISRVYKGGKYELHHFDFYRLHEAGLIQHELADVIDDPKIVTVIEWGEVVSHVLPDERLTIHIKRTGDEERRLTFEYPDSLSYLLENIC